MTNHEQGAWHREVIDASTEATLLALRDAHLLDHFYLAGGTGLALQFGHRLSLDLDFFSPEQFDEDALLQRVQILEGFALAAKAPYTLHATVQKTKVSFLGYAYPLPFGTNRFLDVAVADPRDIACMKVSAIASRGDDVDRANHCRLSREPVDHTSSPDKAPARIVKRTETTTLHSKSYLGVRSIHAG